MKHVSPDRLADAAVKRGWRLVRVNGSHHVFKSGGRTVVIPFHRGTMAPGTQRAVMRTLGISDGDI